MAALNFPDPNVQTSYTNPDTGITYEWANGVWKSVSSALTAPELFVDADGDNLTGNLTLGTDKIVLNATDGSASFAGVVVGQSRISSIRTDLEAGYSNNTISFNTTSNHTGSTKAYSYIATRIPNGGSAEVVSALRTDGSASFAGGINAAHLIGVSPDARRAGVNPLSDTGPFYFVGTDGNVKFKVAQSGGIAISNVNTETNPKTSLSSDGSATFAGGDVNIDIDGRVGVGTNSPAHLLDLSSAGSATTCRINADTSNTASLILSESNAVKWQFSSINGDDNRLGIVNQSSSEVITVEQAGRVGIGTSNPTRKLDISGSGGTSIRIIDTSSYAELSLNGAGNANFIESDDDLAYNVGGSERMRLDSEGRLLVGTSSNQGDYLLQVKDGDISSTKLTGAGGGNAAQMLRFRVHNTNNTAQSASLAGVSAETVSNWGGVLTFHTKPTNGTPNESLTERMRIDSSGRLLVGTSSWSAGARAVIVGNSTVPTGNGVLSLSRGNNTALVAGDPVANIEFTNTSAATYARISVEADGSTGTTTDLPGRLMFWTTADGASSPTERMRITNIGNTIFAASSTAGGSANFINNNDVGFSADGGYGQQLKMGNTYGGGKGYVLFHYNSTSAVIGAIIAAGSSGGTATGVLYNTTSDYRLKENVVTLTEAIDRVKHLKPSRFNFIADPNRTVDGFLAHEAQTVVPEAVTGTHDEVDDDGNAVMQGIDQSKLVPLLTAALQEAIAKIETLEQRLSDAGIA